MTGILLGLAVIAAGFVLAVFFKRWAKSDADGLKKMSDRSSPKPQFSRNAATAPAAKGGLRKRGSASDFGRR